jgi:uncharacterized protein (TIGR03083 family)
VIDQVQLRTTANRRAIARLFAQLDDDQLDTPSLCEGWTCRDVLGHLVMSLDLTFLRFLREVARDRGRAGVTSSRLARAYGARPVAALVQHLEDRSDVALAPPGVGALGPFADSCIHLRDVAIPLGIATSPPTRDWVRVLDFLTTSRARRRASFPAAESRRCSCRPATPPGAAAAGPRSSAPAKPSPCHSPAGQYCSTS